jgi:hypothetical protein
MCAGSWGNLCEEFGQPDEVVGGHREGELPIDLEQPAMPHLAQAGHVDAKAQFRSLAEPWADTGTSTGRLMLAVLGGLADVERDLIRTRTAEGRSRVKARGGQPMGRPPSLTSAERGHQTARAGRYIARIGGQLRPQHFYHAPRDTGSLKPC